MLEYISMYLIFGKPVLMYLGLLTLIMMLTTATLGYLNFKGYNINFKYHSLFAKITILCALIHGFFGILLYIK